MTLSHTHPGCPHRAPRIMIYEDDPSVADMLGKLLREAGFDASVAHHFDTALATLDAGPGVDILLNDIVVPRGLSGLALARMARMRKRDVKIIYMTAYDLPGVEREALGPVLRKPIAAEELLATIRRTLAEPAD